MENVVLRASLSQAFQLKIDNQCNEKNQQICKANSISHMIHTQQAC